MKVQRAALITLQAHPEKQAHACYEFRYILSGRGVFYFGVNRKVAVVPGDLVWNRPWDPHIMTSSSKVVFISFWLDGDFPSQPAVPAKKLHNGGSLAVGEQHEVFFHRLRLDAQSDSPWRKASSAYRLAGWVMEVLARGEKTAGGEDIAVRECLQRFSASPFTPHPLDRLANSLGLSVSQLIRRFKSGMGTTPSTYLTNIRLEEACRLLINTSITLEEIAIRTGTGDGFSFSKLFRRHFKESPGAYRKRERGG